MQEQVSYEEAIVRKYPEPVVIAIGRDKSGKPNPITLGWSMVTSGEPAMMAISIGKTRYTLEAVRHSKEFVISFPSEDMAEETLFYGSHSGRDMDKLKEYGAKILPVAKVDSVLLADATANFECKLVSEMETGDHVIFVGEIVASHVNKQPRGRLYTRGPNYQLGGVS